MARRTAGAKVQLLDTALLAQSALAVDADGNFLCLDLPSPQRPARKQVQDLTGSIPVSKFGLNRRQADRRQWELG